MDTLEITLEIKEGNAEVVIGKTKQNLNDFVKEIEGKAPTLKFKVSGESFIDLNKLEKRAEETRKSFAGIAAQRLDNGQIGILSKEIVRASERSRQLSFDISAIKKELSNPNRKSSIAFLTDELRAAEKEADALNRKLTALPSQSVSGGLSGKSGGKSGGGRRGRITDFQATALELTDDFVPEGFNRPFNAAARGLIGINALSLTTVATFGAIAAVGFGIVKITENIRAEAEKRLKVEESIAAASNKQLLAQIASLKNLKELRANDAVDRIIAQNSKTASPDELKARRATTEKLLSLNPAGANAERFKDQIREIDARLIEIPIERNKLADEAWKKSIEDRKKAQESEIKVQERAARAQEKFNKSVEDGTKKVEELGKKYSETFDSLFARSQKENPFVQIFSEGEKSLKSLRENLKGLPLELQQTAIAIQQKINGNALFSTKLDNNLDVFDLRERAKNFRNPQETEEQKRKRIDDAALRSVNAGNFFAGGVFGNYGSFLANKAGGFDKLTDAQKRDIYETRSFGSVAGNASGSTFNDLNQNSLQTSLANDRLRDADKNLSINERLRKQIGIIDDLGGDAEKRAIAERKLVSISSGLNPSEIDGGLRSRLALANENEAGRKSNYERDSLKAQQESVAVQKQIAENNKKLLEVAEKQGVEGLKLYLEILDKSNGKATVTGPAANNQNVSDYYNGDFGFAGGSKTFTNR